MEWDAGLITFERFALDTRRRELLADGMKLPVQQRAFDILEFLILHHDRAVSRDEILRQVYRDVTVLPSNVSVQVHALRAAFRKAGCGEELIRTLTRQRYQFIGTVSETRAIQVVASDVMEATQDRTGPDLPLLPDARWRWVLVPAAMFGLLLAGVLALERSSVFTAKPDAPRLSMIVLPFTNRGGDSSQDYRVDAVTDELIAELARIPGSTVIARETAQIYKKRELTAREIGRALKVRYLLDGSVEPADRTLRISASLTEAATDVVIWSTDFSIPREQIVDAGATIVGRIAAALNVTLIAAENKRALQDARGNPDALDLFYRARSILDRHTSLDDYRQAQALLEQAVHQQADFAPGFAELGWVLVSKLTELDDPDEAADEAKAKAAVRRALALAPENARALAAQGRLLSVDGNYAEAIETARAALALAPNLAEANLVAAYAEYYLGNLSEAVPPLQAMLRIDPEGPGSKLPYSRLGTIRLVQGEYDEAIDDLSRSIAGDAEPPPGHGQWGLQEKSRLMLIAAHQSKGETGLARRLYADYALRWPHRTAWRVGTLAPRTLAALPGFQRLLDALCKAGMPMFADEDVDEHVGSAAAPLPGDSFSPTPLHLPEGQTLRTADMVRLMLDARPKLIIDIGTGTRAVEGAHWQDPSARPDGDNSFVEGEAEPFARRYPAGPIVVMGDGTYGVEAYNAALHLISSGYTQVYWYRGGEEAWAKNQQKGNYLRRD